MTIYEAQGYWARFYGWHSFAKHHPRRVLYLPRCKAVHGFGLSYPLWVLFVDEQGQPLGSWLTLKPNRIRWHRKAYGVVEARSPRDVSQVHHTTPWAVDCFGQKYYEK